MKKIILGGVLAGIAMLLWGFAFQYLAFMLFPGLESEYQNTAIFRPFDDPLMSIFFAYPLILGLVWAYGYSRFCCSCCSGKKDSCCVKNVFCFSLVMWLLGTLPGMVISYASFQISLLMTLVWTVSGYLDALIASFIYSKTVK